MTSILFSNLMKDTLKELSKEDYVAKALTAYINQMSELRKNIEAASKGNVSNEYLLKEYKKMSESIKNISALFKMEIKNYPAKLKSENDFDKLTMVYINENFMKLSPRRPELVPYFKKLHEILNGFINKYDVQTLGAISLRSVKIVNDLLKDGDFFAVERFFLMLKNSRNYINDNIIYIVYYGLFCKEHTLTQRNQNYRKETNSVAISAILNDRSTLPDSIIKHLCSDKQFEKCTPGLLTFMMNTIFMYTGNVGYEDYTLLISKILNNDLENMDEKAKFYDLRKLYTMYEDYFNRTGNDFEIEKILNDIKCDALVFYDVDDDKEDSYGNI